MSNNLHRLRYPYLCQTVPNVNPERQLLLLPYDKPGQTSRTDTRARPLLIPLRPDRLAVTLLLSAKATVANNVAFAGHVSLVVASGHAA